MKVPRATQLFAVESLGIFGTVRYMVFFVIELRSRAVHIAGVRIAPDGAWMQQVARNQLDAEDGFLRNATHLIHDRDPLYTKAWTALLKSEGVKCVPIPASSPNCNPHAERFVKTVRDECLRHFVIFGERHHSQWRARIVPPPPPPADDHREPNDEGSTCSANRRPPTHRSGYRPWRELLKRTFKVQRRALRSVRRSHDAPCARHHHRRHRSHPALAG